MVTIKEGFQILNRSVNNDFKLFRLFIVLKINVFVFI